MWHNRIGLVIGMDNEQSIAPEPRLMIIDEIGDVVAFLASGRSSGVTGPTTHIDGGRHVRM